MNARRLRFGLLALVALTLGALAGCDVSLDVEGSRFACTSDADCASGYTCVELAGVRQCVAADSPAQDVGDTAPDTTDTTTTLPDTADTALDDVSDTGSPGDVDTTGEDTSVDGDTHDTDTAADTTPDLSTDVGDVGDVYLLVDLDHDLPVDVTMTFQDAQGEVVDELDLPPAVRSDPMLHGPVTLPADETFTLSLDDMSIATIDPLEAGEARLYVFGGDVFNGTEIQPISSLEFEPNDANIAGFQTVTGLESLDVLTQGTTLATLDATAVTWVRALSPAMIEVAINVAIGDVGHGSFAFITSTSERQVWIFSGDGWAERLLFIDLESRPARLTVYHTVTCRAYLDQDCVDGAWCEPTELDPDGDIVGECVPPGPQAAGEMCDAAASCAAGHLCVGDSCVAVCSTTLGSSCADGVCVADPAPLYDRCAPPACSPSAQTGCEPGERCVIAEDGNGFRAVCSDMIGTAQPGELCDDMQLCTTGAQCFQDFTGGTEFRCAAFCDTNDTQACESGGQCLSFQNAGAEGLPAHEGLCFDP